MMKPRKLNMETVKEAIKDNLVKEGSPREDWQRDFKIETLQIVAYVAAGGGMIGRQYAERPANAYVDMRAGRLPYNPSCLENIRQVLVAMAEVYGLDPQKLPPMPDFHNCGIF